MSKSNKKTAVRKCAICGRKFTQKSANALYCSKKCYKVGKAAKNKASKAAKKAVAKKPCKCVEKIALAKKPVAKPVAQKKPCKCVKKVEVKIQNPYRAFFVACMVAVSALNDIIHGANSAQKKSAK